MYKVIGEFNAGITSRNGISAVEVKILNMKRLWMYSYVTSAFLNIQPVICRNITFSMKKTA
jgi:hypothetical protein